MLNVDVSNEIWDRSIDWQMLADKAVAAATEVSSRRSLAAAPFAVSISISLADDNEVQQLNAQWRGKDKPTNVLSFPMLGDIDLDELSDSGDREILLGDLILARETCVAEALAKDISLADHTSHLIIHGMLHLLGYDHIDETEGDHMEALEVKALASMGLGNPYDG
jgi:probable rRNA maturation factor